MASVEMESVALEDFMAEVVSPGETVAWATLVEGAGVMKLQLEEIAMV